MIWSPALDEAIRWLTGQMPQMRALRPAISQNGRPTQKRSNPRNSATWKRASVTSPASSRKMEIFACPSIRDTGSMTMRCGMGTLPGEQIHHKGHKGHKEERKREISLVVNRRAQSFLYYLLCVFFVSSLCPL